MKKIDKSLAEIVEDLGVNKGTISRELRRNAGEPGYRPKQVHEKALGCRSKAKLQQDWSMEQVSGWLKRLAGKSLSHECIYQHILADKLAGGDLYSHLRCYKKLW
jgi:IS30 family transposase